MTDSRPAAKAPPRRRRSADSQERFRQELLAHACTVYDAAGSDGLSVRALTEHFGLSPMAFYRYFDSKLALVQAIWQHHYEELLAELEPAGADAATPQERLRATLEAHLDHWHARPDRFRILFASPVSPHEIAIPRGSRPAKPQLVALHLARAMACVPGCTPSPQRQEQIATLISLKLLGYLHATLGQHAHPALGDSAQRRAWIVDDTVEATLRLLATPG